MNVVLDTNVLVSALLTPHGPPARVLDLALSGSVRVAYDDRILDEYRSVLRRERFRFDPAAVADLLAYLQSSGLHVTAPPQSPLRADASDQAFFEVAMAGADALITGNLKHFPLTAGHASVISPARFLARLWR